MGYTTGNPNLKPETSQSFDLGMEQELIQDKFSISINYYQTDVEDRITWRDRTYININESSTKGVETQINYKINKKIHLYRKLYLYQS